MHSRWGFCPVSFWWCKNSQQKTVFGKNRERVRSCTTMCNVSCIISTSSGSKMHKNASWTLIWRRVGKILDIHAQIARNELRPYWPQQFLLLETLMAHMMRGTFLPHKADIFLNQKRYFPNPSWLHVWRRRCRHVLWQIVARWAWSRTRDTLVLKSNMDKRTSSIGEDLRFS